MSLRILHNAENDTWNVKLHEQVKFSIIITVLPQNVIMCISKLQMGKNIEGVVKTCSKFWFATETGQDLIYNTSNDY